MSLTAWGAGGKVGHETPSDMSECKLQPRVATVGTVGLVGALAAVRRQSVWSLRSLLSAGSEAGDQEAWPCGWREEHRDPGGRSRSRVHPHLKRENSGGHSASGDFGRKFILCLGTGKKHPLVVSGRSI